MIDRDTINAVVLAESVEELWAFHRDAMARYGFDRLIYGFSRYVSESSFGDPRDFTLLSNHRAAYMDGFIGRGLYLKAPMTWWLMSRDGAHSWSVIQKMRAADLLQNHEIEVLEFNRQMGVTAGYSISFKSVSTRARGAIGLTAQPGIDQAQVDAIWEREGEDILLLNNLFHLRLLTLPHFIPSRNLTDRQREVLQWVGDGKTAQDIGVLLGLTQATVEKHLRLARETLNVETTAQAVLKAAFLNQIFVLGR